MKKQKLIFFLISIFSIPSILYSQGTTPTAATGTNAAATTSSSKNWQTCSYIDSKGEKKEIKCLYGFQTDSSGYSPKGPKLDEGKANFMPDKKAAAPESFNKPNIEISTETPTVEEGSTATAPTISEENLKRLEQLQKMIKK